MKLFTDEIYGKKITEEYKSHLFLYMFTKYDYELKSFTVKYQNIMIKGNGVDCVDQDRNHSEMDHVRINMIQYGIDLHQISGGRVMAHY